MKKFILLFTSALLYSSCSDSNVGPNWSLYDPSLKGRIDNSDCIELQSEFDAAESNSDRNRARTGEGNYLLMEYIDSKMKEKNCGKYVYYKNSAISNQPDKVYSRRKVNNENLKFRQLDNENDILGNWIGRDETLQISNVDGKKHLRFNDGRQMELQIVLSRQGYIATSYCCDSILEPFVDFQALFLIDESKNSLKIKRLID